MKIGIVVSWKFIGMIFLLIMSANAYSYLVLPEYATEGDYKLQWSETAAGNCFGGGYAGEPYRIYENKNSGPWVVVYTATSPSYKSHYFSNKAPGRYTYYVVVTDCIGSGVRSYTTSQASVLVLGDVENQTNRLGGGYGSVDYYHLDLMGSPAAISSQDGTTR